MTLTVIFLFFTTAVIVTGGAENNENVRDDNPCITENIACPAVDGLDSVYAPLPDCTKFCQCSNGVPYVHNCPGGLHFNPSSNVCDWPENAGCISANTTTTQSTTIYVTNATAEETTATTEANTTTEAPTTIEVTSTEASSIGEVETSCNGSEEETITEVVDDTTNEAEETTTVQATNTTLTKASTNTEVNITTEATATSPTNSTDNLCIQNNILIDCPEVDGPDSVYAPLPDCTKFCQCSNGVPYVHDCPGGLHFNPSLNVCDWPDNAGCTGGNATATERTTIEATNATAEVTAGNSTTTEAAINGGAEASTYVSEEETTTEMVNDTTINTTPSSEQTTICTTVTIRDIITEETTTSEISGTNLCLQNNIECPAVDGPDSVYAALPDCTKFCQCSNGVPYVHNCPDNLHFNPELNVCDWPQNAGCTGSSGGSYSTRIINQELRTICEIVTDSTQSPEIAEVEASSITTKPTTTEETITTEVTTGMVTGSATAEP